MIFYRHYIGDFQRDTAHLSLTERGAYRAMMDYYYASEKPLPNCLDAICRIAGAVNAIERKAVKVAISMFEVRGGALWHKRIEAELEKAGERSDTNREIAVAREARKRADRESRTEHEQSTNRAPYVPRIVTRTEHEQSTKSVTSNQEEEKKKQKLCADAQSDAFVKFWSAYPRKVAKPHALKSWIKLKLGRDDLPQILAGVARARRSDQWLRDDGQFVPHPASWLNDRRWEDEPAAGPDATPSLADIPGVEWQPPAVNYDDPAQAARAPKRFWAEDVV